MAMKPMDAYSQLLCRPEWKRKSFEIMERDGHRCVQCKEMATPGNYLQVDHKHYPRNGFPWEAPNRHLQTVCVRCHKRLTAWRARVSELCGEMNIYEIPLAVEMLESFWGGRQAAPAATVPPLRLEASRKRMELIEGYEREKANLLDLEFTGARSSRVEELDDMIDAAWKQIQEAA